MEKPLKLHILSPEFKFCTIWTPPSSTWNHLEMSNSSKYINFVFWITDITTCCSVHYRAPAKQWAFSCYYRLILHALHLQKATRPIHLLPDERTITSLLFFMCPYIHTVTAAESNRYKQKEKCLL